MTIMKDWKCGRCNWELKLTPVLNTKWEQDTYVCLELGHLNYKWKEECKNI
jgi:hypothetical protein